jgi:hypothetical protein
VNGEPLQLSVGLAGAWLAPVTALVAAFVFGQALAWTYERTYHGLSYSRGFSHALVLSCISAAVLVLAMSHSVIAGLGLFGVLSMIRFRTDLKTPRDLVFVMGTACIGVAAGASALLIAALGTVVFSAVAIYLAVGPFGSRVRYDGVLRFSVEPSPDTGRVVERLLGIFCRRQVLLSTTEVGQHGASERVYQVKFHRPADRDALLAALRDEVRAKDTRLLLQDSTSEY